MSLYLGQLRPQKTCLALGAGQPTVEVLAAFVVLPLLNRRDDILPPRKQVPRAKTPRETLADSGDVAECGDRPARHTKK